MIDPDQPDPQEVQTRTRPTRPLEPGRFSIAGLDLTENRAQVIAKLALAARSCAANPPDHPFLLYPTGVWHCGARSVIHIPEAQCQTRPSISCSR